MSNQNESNINPLLNISGYQIGEDGLTSTTSDRNAWICDSVSYSGTLIRDREADLDFIDESANRRVILKINKITGKEELFVTEIWKKVNGPWYQEFPIIQISFSPNSEEKSWFWFRDHALYGAFDSSKKMLANRVSNEVIGMCSEPLSVEGIVGTLDKESDSSLSVKKLKEEIPEIITYFTSKGLIDGRSY